MSVRETFSAARAFVLRHAVAVRKGLLCLVLVLLCVVPALFVNNVIGYLPLLVALTAIVFLALYMLACRRVLSCKELSTLSNCDRGTHVGFTVRLENKSPLLLSRIEPSFYIGDPFGGKETLAKRVTTLAPFEKRNFEFSVRFDHIGTYSAGLKEVRVFDLLGLFASDVANPRTYNVTVSPRLYDVASVKVTNEVTSESQKMLSSVISDGMDYAGIRDYAMGDPMKTVHWKMSARSRKLVTKLYEVFINPCLTVIFDFNTYPYDDETKLCVFDAIVEAGFSLDRYARDNAIDSSVMFRDTKGRTVREQIADLSDYASLATRMPRIYSDSNLCEAALLIDEESSQYTAANNIIVCTSRFDAALVTSLLSARARGKHVSVVGVVPAQLPKERKQELLRPMRRLSGSGVSVVTIDSAEELRGGLL